MLLFLPLHPQQNNSPFFVKAALLSSSISFADFETKLLSVFRSSPNSLQFRTSSILLDNCYEGIHSPVLEADVL